RRRRPARWRRGGSRERQEDAWDETSEGLGENVGELPLPTGRDAFDLVDLPPIRARHKREHRLLIAPTIVKPDGHQRLLVVGDREVDLQVGEEILLRIDERVEGETAKFAPRLIGGDELGE